MISESYKKLNEELHKSDETFGISGSRYAEIARALSQWGRKPILDYGCGKAILEYTVGPAYKVTNYDPCIEKYSARPEPHPVVFCTDVMEHVEPEFVEDVLADVRRLTTESAFFAICVSPALKTLSDGRNAHISLHPIEWWKDKVVAAGFEITDTFNDAHDAKTFGMICK
jgi:hypothetical protein